MHQLSVATVDSPQTSLVIKLVRDQSLCPTPNKRKLTNSHQQTRFKSAGVFRHTKLHHSSQETSFF